MNIKLGDLCKIQAGGTPSRSKQEYWNKGEIPWVKIGDIESKYLNKTSEFITDEGLKNSSAKKIEKGSILYTIFATLGEVCINNIDVTTNQAIAGITLKDDKVYIDYLYYFLKSLKNYVNAIGRGVAQNNINLTLLRGFDVPVPDKNRQLIIAQSLSNIEKMINNKKQQLSEYDQLIKSRFVEMFESFEKTDLSNIAEIIMGQSPDSAYYNENGVGLPFFQGKADFGAKYTNVSYWTTKPSKTAKKGNVLMSVRAPVGPVNISSVDCCIGRGLCSINAIPNKTNNEFLYNALITIQDQITAMGTGSTFKAINKSDVYAIKLPLAPISLQNEFANFVEQVDKLKFENELLYCVNRFTRIKQTKLVCYKGVTL